MSFPPKPDGWLLTKELYARWNRTFWPAFHLLLQEGRDWVRLSEGSLKRGDGWRERAAFRPEAVRAIELYKDARLSEARDLLLGRALLPPPPSTPMPAAPADPAGLEEEMEVVSQPRPYPDGVRHFPNPHVILARRANGDVVTVRVARSVHFTPRTTGGAPMKLRARKGGWPPYWSLIGPLPRWPGRW